MAGGYEHPLHHTTSQQHYLPLFHSLNSLRSRRPSLHPFPFPFINVDEYDDLKLRRTRTCSCNLAPLCCRNEHIHARLCCRTLKHTHTHTQFDWEIRGQEVHLSRYVHCTIDRQNAIENRNCSLDDVVNGKIYAYSEPFIHTSHIAQGALNEAQSFATGCHPFSRFPLFVVAQTRKCRRPYCNSIYNCNANRTMQCMRNFRIHLL